MRMGMRVRQGGGLRLIGRFEYGSSCEIRCEFAHKENERGS